jgi:hypothetical protein
MAEFYIDPALGNDADGGSIAHPWKTISKANATLFAGDAAYLMNGTYNDRIFPSHSGSAGNPISYKNYPGHSPTLKGTDQGYGIFRFSVGRNYFIIDGISVDGSPRDNSLPQWWFVWNEGDYNIIQNCPLTNGTANVDGGVRILGNYNKLLNCRVAHAGCYNLGDVWIEGSYNLVDGCSIMDVGHDCINNFGHHNIIRNNDLYNPIYRVADAAHSGGSDARAYLVFDGNRVHGSPIHGMQANSPYQIIRRNTVYDNSQHGLGIYGGQPGVGSSSHSRIYNNTFYNNGGVAVKLNKNGTDSIDIVLKNNISYKNIGGFTWYENVDPANQHEINNFNGDPHFIDEGGRDFRLAADSPCRNAGAFLTTAIGTGSGTSIPVVDASYFIDGFGIVAGDIIQLQGNPDPLTIVGIDYAANTITVNRPTSWTNGQGIALGRIDAAPNIGAYEYKEETMAIKKTVPFTLVVSAAPDFFPAILPSSLSVAKGVVAVYNISFTAQGGFAGPVALAVLNLPTGAVATFDKTSINVTETAALSITTGSVALGTFSLSVEGTANL